MTRRTILLVALLAALAAAAICCYPTPQHRADLIVRALCEAGRLPLPLPLERQRIKWLASMNPL